MLPHYLRAAQHSKNPTGPEYRPYEPKLQSKLKDFFRSPAIAPSRRWKHEGNNELLLVPTSHQKIMASPIYPQVQHSHVFRHLLN